MAAKVHGTALATALQAWVDGATNIEMRFLSGYTPNPDDSYWSDISASEASGAPQVTLTNVTVTYDTTNDRVEFDFDNVSEASITTDTDGIAIVDDTGNAATSEVLYTADITQLQPTDGTLAINLDAEGLFALGTNAA